MAKVRLDPDALQVQTFSTAAEPLLAEGTDESGRLGSCVSACGLCPSIDYC